MHERDRQRLILEALQGRAVATVASVADLTGASAATIRRDFAVLADQGLLRKVRGGVEPLQASVHPSGVRSAAPPGPSCLPQKRAIAAEAVRLCENGDSIIINGGSTTFQMVFALAAKRLQVLTNAFGVADHLLRHSTCDVFLPSGAIYRPQNIVLSPFEDDGTVHYRARRMFMGAQGVSRLGIMESDPLVIQSEQRLMRQADEVVLLVDSSKFHARSSMILAPLARAATVITDDGLPDEARDMIEQAGVRLIVAPALAPGRRHGPQSPA